MQSVTRGSRRMLPQKPASSLVTSQKHSPSYSYHVGECAAGGLDGEADVAPHLLGLAARVADADDLVVLIEGDLACDVERVAAADRVGVRFGRGREAVGLEIGAVHWLLLGRWVR